MEENWLVYLNGEMVPLQDAKISVFDRGFQYGDSVFEGLRCYDGRIFKLNEHTDRLYRSAQAIGIAIPMSKEEFSSAVKRVVRENGFQNAHIKPIVSRGVAWKLGLDPKNTTEPTIVILARPIGRSMFEEGTGFKLASVSVRKIPAACFDPRVKSCNYLANILARSEAVASGAHEALMLDLNGYVAEGAADNVFLVKGEGLYTSSVQDALEGITRETVIDLARRHGMPVHEARLTIYDVYNADEIFVSGSAAGIVAVTEVDGRIVSGGKAGPVTRKLSDAYDEEVKRGEPVYE
jgi:branched-chain amino acid aminotransferase